VTRRGDGYEVVGDTQVELGRRTETGGVFAAWSWDGHELRLENDRYGLFPVFYAAGGDRIAVSDSLVELIRRGDAHRLDVDALNVFHRLGFFLGEDTPLADARALPPSAVLVWKGELSVEGKRELGGHLDLTREEAIAGYAEVFRAAVGRLLTDEPFALPLSGGRDSRHIFLELVAAGCRPEYTLTGRNWRGTQFDTNDDEVARTLSRDLGLRHVEVPRLESRAEAEVRKNLLTHFCADEHAWLVPIGDALVDVEVFYDGLAGGVLSAGDFESPLTAELAAKGRLEELADAILASWGDSPAESLEFGLAEGRSPWELYDLRRQRVVQELEAVAETANPVAHFYFHNRTRREVALAPFGVLGTKAHALCPYIDHDVVAFLLSLPDDLMADGSFHTDTIAFAHPGYADRPYAALRPGTPAPREYRRLLLETVVRGGRTGPSRVPHVAAIKARKLVGSRRGAAYRAINPLWLLYLWQLEDELARA
jgi:asparagine synthase (glutamine-hydrolysing)